MLVVFWVWRVIQLGITKIRYIFQRLGSRIRIYLGVYERSSLSWAVLVGFVIVTGYVCVEFEYFIQHIHIPLQ